MGRSVLFVSSAEKEFAEERAAIRDFVRGDALLRRYFDVFLFEDQPASDRRADAVYLDRVDACGVHVGLFGNEYGDEDDDGKSPTEREFDRATEKGKRRLIFVKGQDDKSKHPKMRKLIRKAGSQLIRRRFTDTPDLTATLYASLVDHMETRHLFSMGATRQEPAKPATNREGAMNEGAKIGPQRVLMALILKYRDEGEGLKGASRQEDLLGPKEAKGAQRGRSSRPQRKLHRYLIRNCLNYASKASKADQQGGQIGAKGANLAGDSG